MSKKETENIEEQNVQQPDFVKELIEKGTVTLKAKTRDELAAMVNDIPSEVHYGVGAVGQNYELGIFTLRIDLINKE